jgi:hypothetical protein
MIGKPVTETSLDVDKFMINPELTENEFDIFFNQNGFSRVSDDVGKNPAFANADYINKNENIIVELKVLNKEQFKDGGIIDSLKSIIIQPQNIDSSGCGQYTFTLPDLNREGKHDAFEEPLRRSLKSANRQLKETKKFYYPNSEYSGFVIIAQTGLSSLSPPLTAALVQKILFYEFSSIDGVLICTPHHQKIDPITRNKNPECVSVTNDRIPKLRKQCIALADKWIEFFNNNGLTRN